MEKIAIIKINVSTIKLSLIDVAPNGYYNLFDEIVENVKIGSSITQYSLIKPNIINESLTILKLYRKICDANNVCKIVAVAESFVKSAKNQKSYFDEIYNNTGINFNIYSMEDEVKLVYKGITSLIDVSKAIGVYITQNKTHLINFNRRTIVNSATLDYGYLNLSDKFADETDSEKKSELMVNEIKTLLEESDFASSVEPESIYVGAGTVFESLGKLSRKVSKYQLDIENNYTLTKESLDAVYDVLKGLDLDKTKRIRGISEDRADCLASGASITKAIFEVCNCSSISVCSNALDESIINQSLPVEASERVIPSDMLSSSLETIRVFYDRELSNTANVYNLAIMLFKQLRVIHKLPRSYIKPLRIAASMYNCGTRISFENYSKNCFDIILNSKILGVTQKDILLAGFVCKAQNLDNLTLSDWIKYKDILTDEDLDAVRKLGVMIQLACSMDKSRMGNITDITCDILGDSIIMKTIVKDDASFDILQAQKVAPDFKRVFKKVLQVI